MCTVVIQMVVVGPDAEEKTRENVKHVTSRANKARRPHKITRGSRGRQVQLGLGIDWGVAIDNCPIIEYQ